MIAEFECKMETHQSKLTDLCLSCIKSSRIRSFWLSLLGILYSEEPGPSNLNPGEKSKTCRLSNVHTQVCYLLRWTVSYLISPEGGRRWSWDTMVLKVFVLPRCLYTSRYLSMLTSHADGLTHLCTYHKWTNYPPPFFKDSLLPSASPLKLNFDSLKINFSKHLFTCTH